MRSHLEWQVQRWSPMLRKVHSAWDRADLEQVTKASSVPCSFAGFAMSLGWETSTLQTNIVRPAKLDSIVPAEEELVGFFFCCHTLYLQEEALLSQQ